METVPFTLVHREGKTPVASNGTVGLTCPDEGGVVFLRRGIRVTRAAPLGERVLPLLNELAGQVLADPTMPAHEIRARLHALQLQCVESKQVNVEWAVAELDGVRCYTDGETVLLTRQDLRV